MSSTPGDQSPSVVKQVDHQITGTGLTAIWTPVSGRKIVFQGCALRACVITALVGATPGTGIVIAENVSSPMVSLGGFRTATDAAGTDYGFVFINLATGWPFSAVNAPLFLGAHLNATIGAGVIRVVGLIWGDEQ